MQRTAALQGIEINAVMRNTYLLLSMTMVVSAITAYASTSVAFSAGGYLAVAIAGFVTLFATMLLRNSPWGIALVFLFTGLEGFSLGPVLQHYLHMKNGAFIIASAAGGTAAIFMGLSLYTLISRRNFSFMGGFLFAGLIALLVVSLVGLFIPSTALQLAVAGVSVLLFSGFILYDTSEIIHGGETNYVMATINLYLDILNVFLALLRISGFLGGSDD